VLKLLSLIRNIPISSPVFRAGASYNVYITIYGFEKIEVTAVLTAWEDGGDIETDIEDGK
jgi:hypothetical protein